jgi:hypothetical protein
MKLAVLATSLGEIEQEERFESPEPALPRGSAFALTHEQL